MSTRSNLRPVVVLKAATMTTDQTSAVTVLQSITEIAYMFFWSGTSPVGAIAIQGSNDYSLNPNGTVNNAGTWTPLTVSYNGSNVSSIPISGNSGSGIVDIVKTALYAVQCVYTAVSGTGTITIVVNGKIS